MKIKVIYFVSTLESGGPTNVIFNIIKYVDRNKIDPIIVTMSSEPAKSRKKDFEKIGVKVFQSDQTRIQWFLSKGAKIKSIVDDIAPHIIHSHSLRPDLFSEKHLKGYKRMSTIHADLHANYIDTYGQFIGKYFASLQLLKVADFDQVIACSRSVYNLYRQRLKSLVCIQNGVDQEIFYAVPDNFRLEMRKKLSVPVAKNIFITVGSLCKRKDPATVIEGFLASNVANNSLLMILGNGKLVDQLKKRYSGCENIVFKGFTSDVKSYLQIADCFISASLSEGLPNTVLEALSCGLPVCLSDIPSHQEILSIDKGAGRMFRCRDYADLANAINSLASENLQSAREAALGIIARELDSRQMAQAYEELYLRCTLEKIGQ